MFLVHLICNKQPLLKMGTGFQAFSVVKVLRNLTPQKITRGVKLREQVSEKSNLPVVINEIIGGLLLRSTVLLCPKSPKSL